MIEIKAKDLLKTDYQILGEKYINLNKGIDELIKKYEEKVDYEERELSNNHNSFDHYRIISNCKEIIIDLKKLKGE